MLTRRGQIRWFDKLKHGPQCPMDRCIRADFLEKTWPRHDRFRMNRLAHELKKIDARLEIIYDPATALNAWTPGHHLYLRVKRAAVPSQDELKLQFPLQENIPAQWGESPALPPGDWVLEVVKRRHLQRWGSTPEQARARQQKELDDGIAKYTAAQDAMAANAFDESKKDADKFVHHKAISEPIEGLKRGPGRPRKVTV